MSETREVIKIIGDILKEQMQLREDQIMLAYSKYDIPANADLFISLSYLSGKAIGNVSYFDPETNHETLTTTMNDLIQIDIMSFDSSARQRKEEVIASLNSIYSQQQQDTYNFQIGRIPSEFINVSSLEETKFLNRFTISVAVTSLSTITRYPDYYDKFDNAEATFNV